jgi:hypothetical protein
MSSQITISKIGQGVTGTCAVTPPAPASAYQIQISPDTSLTFTPGNGANQVGLYTEFQLVIPPSGADTINLHTGGVLGSQTFTLQNFDNSGTASFTTGIKYVEFYLQPGAASVTLTPGGANGFQGWMGVGNETTTIRGSTTAQVGGQGGNFRNVCGDSFGFTVSASQANLVVTNLDSSNTATLNGYLSGF